MRRIPIAPLAAALALGFAALAAQSAEPLLKPGQITESALLDALTPDDGVRSRSIRPSMTGGASQQTASGRAGLLITFQTGSAELTPETRSALDEVGKALKSERLAGFSFRIEGHADPRGGDDLNYRLSQARAESVMDYLVSAHGVDRSRLRAEGKGSSELLNRDDPAAPENRRVTITTLK